MEDEIRRSLGNLNSISPRPNRVPARCTVRRAIVSFRLRSCPSLFPRVFPRAKVENCSRAGGGGWDSSIRADGTRRVPRATFRPRGPAVLQRHVCITRSTASRPAGVVCGKALLAPRVPQLNSQAFRLIYGAGREATLPRAPLDSAPLLPASTSPR